jgi:hypothetical protein
MFRPSSTTEKARRKRAVPSFSEAARIVRAQTASPQRAERSSEFRSQASDDDAFPARAGGRTISLPGAAGSRRSEKLTAWLRAVETGKPISGTDRLALELLHEEME